MEATEFNKAQYAYVFSAKAKCDKLKCVVDNTQKYCVITGFKEEDENFKSNIASHFPIVIFTKLSVV
ncbi:MAG: hypothetical protein ACJAUP_000503 [Cellvibrionaceae bacterium]|jgi:hypothetical protein